MQIFLHIQASESFFCGELPHKAPENAMHTERPLDAANGVVPQSAVMAFVSDNPEAKAFSVHAGGCAGAAGQKVGKKKEGAQ